MADFEFVRRLNAGQFGEVWLANDRALGEFRAVKRVDPTKVRDPANVHSEAQALAAARHPNVVTVHEAGYLPGGELYVAMEYLPDGSLQDRIAAGDVPLPLIRSVGIDVCRGLEYAHGCGLLHHDVKPGNILLAADGTAKLSDFGLAEHVGMGGTGAPIGYRPHRAPELIAGQPATAASDVYALGVTLHRAINGDPPLPTSDLHELERMIVSGEFPDRQLYPIYVPPALIRIINKALEVDPGRRYQTPEEMRRALERVPVRCDWTMSESDDLIVLDGQSQDGIARIEANRSSDKRWTIGVKTGRSQLRVNRGFGASGLTKKQMRAHVRRIASLFTTDRER
jgi:serine/threonine-protein kinase